MLLILCAHTQTNIRFIYTNYNTITRKPRKFYTLFVFMLKMDFHPLSLSVPFLPPVCFCPSPPVFPSNSVVNPNYIQTLLLFYGF